MTDIDGLKNKLWGAIREVQRRGSEVRSGGRYHNCGCDSCKWRGLCLLGSIHEFVGDPSKWGVLRTAVEYLSIEPREVKLLEAGFEGWNYNCDDSTDPFYKLGEEIRTELAQ